jgi:hypothetical protein
MPKRRVRRHSVVQPLDADYRLIPLTKGQNAIVDAADYDWLNQWNWTAVWNSCTKSFYGKRRGASMHRVILGLMPGEPGDHINRNTLDNRRKNLRKANFSQNDCNRGPQGNNTSGYKGVCFNHEGWVARIAINGETKYLGNFVTKEDAARAYDRAAKELHGEFAYQNFSS